MSMTGRVYRVGSDERYFAVFDMTGMTDLKVRHGMLTRLAGHLTMGTWIEHHTDGTLDPAWISGALTTASSVPKGAGVKILVNVGMVVFKLSIAGDPGASLAPPEQPKLAFTFDPDGEPQRSVVAPLVSSDALAEEDTETDDDDAAWQVLAARTSACPGTGDGVVVAMVDTGVRTDHVEFDGALVVRGPRYDDNGAVVETMHTDDPHGHGTRMASAVVGRRCGVARDATLYMVAGLDAHKDTRLLGLLVSIDDAADGPHGVPVDVLSLSLEMEPDALETAASQDIALALQNVGSIGTLVLVAVGNDGDPSKNECASALAGLGGSLAVGACRQDGQVSGLSGWSATRGVPNLYAYGIGVLVPLRFDDAGYSTYDGQSSYATAYTAGVAACVVGREPVLRGEVGSTRARLLALAAPATDPDARPRGTPAGIARICGDDGDVRRQDDVAHSPTPSDSTTTSTPRQDLASTPHTERCMSDTTDTTDTTTDTNTGVGGAEADEGTWIVYSVDEATGKAASIVGYLWSQKYDTGKYHEYFIFDDKVFNPDYERLPFVKTLMFWRMASQPNIASKGDFEAWVKNDAPHKITSLVLRYANTVVNSSGWPV